MSQGLNYSIPSAPILEVGKNSIIDKFLTERHSSLSDLLRCLLILTTKKLEFILQNIHQFYVSFFWIFFLPLSHSNHIRNHIGQYKSCYHS